jgi:hypothetical protein
MCSTVIFVMLICRVSICIRVHCNENHIFVFLKRNCTTSVPISPYMCLWAIYIYISMIRSTFSCSRIGRLILGMHKSLTDTWMRNWDWCCAISFLGIFVSTFRYCVLCSVFWRNTSFNPVCLGRYGDALNPWGDILTIARAWCVSSPAAKARIVLCLKGHCREINKYTSADGYGSHYNLGLQNAPLISWRDFKF